jgi:crotonobetainyl-CoA:carnitine CoA-transferase CaiB-like acyl-CoA transferase
VLAELGRLVSDAAPATEEGQVVRKQLEPGDRGENAQSAFLAPYRVLDLTDERGLLAGHLLAQLGAEVIQIEPPGGSPARRVGPFDEAGDHRSLFWSAYAAGKRGVSLALDTPEGRDLLLRLAAQADVLIESADPGVMDALGLGYEQLRAVNPGLVHVSITAFGSSGPKARYADSDLVVWASAGPLAPHRSARGTPLRISVPQAFHQASSDAACGALVALLARARTGLGQHVDVSAQASCTVCTLFAHLAAAVGHPDYDYHTLQSVAKPGKGQLDLSGSGARTRQTKWPVRNGLVEMHIGIGAAAGRFSNALFGWFGEIGERPDEFAWDWIAIPELVERGEIEVEQVERARDHVGRVLARFTVQELVQVAQAKGFMLAPILTTADLLESRQFAARGLFARVDEAGRTRSVPRPFATGCGAEAVRLRPAPAVGQDNAEIFRQPAGLAPEAADEFADWGAAEQPLKGLKVLDFAWVVAGPLVGRALADFGATVVRVESSQRLDTARVLGPFPNGVVDPQGSVAYENCNANKFGLALDLRREDARAVARDLVAWADVVIESFVPGQMARFGLDYPRLKAINPGLIMVSSSLMGQTGPNAEITGFGNIGAAFSGLQRIVGEPGEPPLGPYGPYTDYVAPRFALLALLAAVDRRRRSGGEGCHLDISQAEATVSLIAPQILDAEANGRIAEAKGNRDDHFAPNGVFRARGADRWVAITARNDTEWRRLASLMGGEALAEDARFATLADRKRNEDELEALVAAWSAGQDPLDVERRLQAEGVPAHVVAQTGDIVGDPQLAARGSIVRLPHPRFGETVIDAARFSLSETPARYERPAPTVGRDNRYVLAELLGYPEERIRALGEAGALR